MKNLCIYGKYLYLKNNETGKKLVNSEIFVQLKRTGYNMLIFIVVAYAFLSQGRSPQGRHRQGRLVGAADVRSSIRSAMKEANGLVSNRHNNFDRVAPGRNFQRTCNQLPNPKLGLVGSQI